MKSKILILTFLLCGLFLSSGSLSEAMVSRAGAGPECIKRINMWTEDAAGKPMAKLASCPNHIYATIGGGFNIDYEIISYHPNATYYVEMRYFNSEGTDLGLFASETTNNVTEVDPPTDPRTFSCSRNDRPGFSRVASFKNKYNCLEDNCGWIQVTATCSLCGAPPEIFYFPVVFLPATGRPISVEATSGGNNLANLSVQAPLAFNAILTYTAGEWLSTRTVTLLVDIGAGPTITTDPDFIAAGLYIKSQNVSDWGENDPLPNPVPVCVNGSVTDELGTNSGTVLFTIEPNPNE